MKNPVIQFFKVELFSSPFLGILFLIGNILGIILMFICGFHPIIVWTVGGPFIVIWCALICDFTEKVSSSTDSKSKVSPSFNSEVCPHCYGEIEVIEETINLLSIQKKIVKKCKKCGKEFNSTAHYLD